MEAGLLNKKRFYEAQEYETAIQQRNEAFQQIEALKLDKARLLAEKDRVTKELKDLRDEQSRQVQKAIKENMRNLDQQGMQKVIDLNNESIRQQREDQERAALSEFDHARVAQLEDENQRLRAENDLLRAENDELKSVVIELSKKVDLQNSKIELQQTQIELQQTQINQQQAQFNQQQSQIDQIVSRLDNSERIDTPMQQSTERYEQAQAQAVAQAAVKPSWLDSAMTMHVTREGNVHVQDANGDYNYSYGQTQNLKANPDLYKASVLHAGGAFNQQGKVIQYDQSGNPLNGPAQNNTQWLQAYDRCEQKMKDAEADYNRAMDEMEVEGLEQDEIDERVTALREDCAVAQTEAQQEFDAFKDQEQGLNSIGSGDLDAKLMQEERLSQEADAQESKGEEATQNEEQTTDDLQEGTAVDQQNAGDSLQPGRTLSKSEHEQEQQPEQAQGDESKAQMVGGDGQGQSAAATKTPEAPEQVDASEQEIHRTAGQVEPEAQAEPERAQFAVEDSTDYPIEESPRNEYCESSANAAIEAQQAEPPGVAMSADVQRRR